ncbi:MAG: RNA pseudouridine synthase [Kiritimatiellales bacterium]
MNFNVLYHDNHLLAVNKPAGLLTQPSGTERTSLEDCAKAYIREVNNKSGNVFLHAVHRLDRVVSGVVLFACTGKALSRLNADMRARRFKKLYHAVVSGTPPEAAGSLFHYLLHGDFKAEVVGENHPGARECRLEYRVLQTGGGISLLEIQLHTGRYHQIRAQLAAAGCPVLADGKYGSPDKRSGGTIALHHRQLTVIHPVSKESIVIDAPYPLHFPAVKN